MTTPFARRITKARVARGWNKTQLARELTCYLHETHGEHESVSRTTVGNWEAAKHYPVAPHREALREVLGLQNLDPESASDAEIDSEGADYALLGWDDLALVNKSDGRLPLARKRRPSLDVADSPLAKEDCFALPLVDDSMEPRFHAGDVIVLNRRLSPEDGDFVIARLASGEHLFRQYIVRGKKAYDLVALNADEDWTTHSVNARAPAVIVGVLVEHRIRYRRPSRKLIALPRPRDH